jgi:hypothetical protein
MLHGDSWWQQTDMSVCRSSGAYSHAQRIVTDRISGDIQAGSAGDGWVAQP